MITETLFGRLSLSKSIEFGATSLTSLAHVQKDFMNHGKFKIKSSEINVGEILARNERDIVQIQHANSQSDGVKAASVLFTYHGLDTNELYRAPSASSIFHANMTKTHCIV